MKLLTRLILILGLCGTVYGDTFKEEPPAAPAAPTVKKPAKHSHRKPASSSGQVAVSSGTATLANAAGVNSAITGLARQAINAALPEHPAVANALDQAVTSLASADTQVLAPFVNSQPSTRGSAAAPPANAAVSLSAGIQTLNGEIAPAVNLRIWPNGRISNGSPTTSISDIRSPFSVEVGGAVSNSPSESFKSAAQTVDSTQYSANIKSFFELHVAGIYALPHGNQTWVVPDAGLGVSMVHVENQLQAMTTVMEQSNGQAYPNQTVQYATQDRIGWSPLVRLGATLFPEHLFSLRVDAAYVGYANVVNDFGTTLDLGFSGMMYRAILEVRI